MASLVFASEFSLLGLFFFLLMLKNTESSEGTSVKTCHSDGLLLLGVSLVHIS